MQKKFLLHTCCAPCSIAVIDELKDLFDLTVFFYNPNIHPKAEYLKRKKYVIRVCNEWGVTMIDMDYEVEKWYEKTKGMEQEPEGGRRCYQCFDLRLSRTARYANEKSFDYFGTSLTSGRSKNSQVINELGFEIGKLYGVQFYNEDWKKKGREEKGRKMAEERNIYRQDYCGCIYSKIKRLEGKIKE